MTRTRLPVLGVLLLIGACRDSTTEPIQSTVTGQAAISDARTGNQSESNPHFYWLTPIRPAPPAESLGEVEPLASPSVTVVCQDSNQLSTCEPDVPLATFTRGSGLIQELNLFKAEFAARGLRVSGGGKYTTYRIRVWTDPLEDFGGPFELGYADFRVVKATETVKAPPSDIVLVADGRTLPIKFRLEKGAYEHELWANLAQGRTDPDDEPLCQENCSVTIIPTDAPTVAALAEGGTDVTAMKFEANDVTETSVLVIDERTIGGEVEECANGVTLEKKYCYRYRITPDEPFNNPVRFGICPREIPLDETSPWRILKVDYVDDAPVVTRPPEADVSDFLPCSPPVTPGAVAQPLAAALGSGRPWGGMAGDLSDLFWAIDAELQAVSATNGTAAAGTVVPITVKIMSTYLAAGLAGQQVTFEVTSAVGTLSATTAVTDAQGEATVQWTLGTGANTVAVNAPFALGSPIRFEWTGTSLTLPDLVAKVYGADATAVLPGQWVTVYDSVKNVGAEGPAGNSNFAVTHYLSTDPVLDVGDTELGWGYSVWTYHLSVGWGVPYADVLQIPDTTPAGTYYVIVVADARPNNPPLGVIEADESNNWDATEGTLLVVDPASLTADVINDPASFDSAGCGDSGNPLVQVFRPAAAPLRAVALRLKTGYNFPQGGMSTHIAILDASDPEAPFTLASQSISINPSATPQWVTFVLRTPIDVTPGVPYAIQWSSPTPAGVNAGLVMTLVSRTDNPYAGGYAGCQATANLPDPGATLDVNFRTYR